jgi:hypothetical protein
LSFVISAIQCDAKHRAYAGRNEGAGAIWIYLFPSPFEGSYDSRFPIVH